MTSSNKLIPEANGQAKRLIADAQAYKQQVVLHAKGDTARYLAVLSEYTRAPGVTKERLYLDTMQQVLSNTSKIVVDSMGGNSLVMLPLDKLLGMDFNGTKTRVPFALPPEALIDSTTSPNGQDNVYGGNTTNSTHISGGY